MNFRDGLATLKYRKRHPANTSSVKSEKGPVQTFIYGNRPQGIVYESIDSKEEYPADANRESIVSILSKFDETNEIRISSTKAAYLDLESFININVDNSDVSGVSVVTSKSVRGDMKSVDISLVLNKRPVNLSDITSSSNSWKQTAGARAKMRKRQDILNWRREQLGLERKPYKV